MDKEKTRCIWGILSFSIGWFLLLNCIVFVISILLKYIYTWLPSIMFLFFSFSIGLIFGIIGFYRDGRRNFAFAGLIVDSTGFIFLIIITALFQA